MEYNVKINLLRNSNQTMSGYLNIDIFPGENKVQGDISNLNNLVDDASCYEIVARNVLEYIPHQEIPQVVAHWVQKLSHGGKIIINTTDLKSVSKSIIRDNITPSETLEILYGKQLNALDCKKSAVTTQILSALLESNGLKIINKCIDSYELSITAERP